MPLLLLTEGGPEAGLLRRLRLAEPRRVVRIALLLAGVTWLPLLLLSAWQGLLVEPAQGSFLSDLTTHARLLVALPVLVLAELRIGASLQPVAIHFIEAGLVRPEDRERFVGFVHDSLRLRDSRIAGLLVLAAVCLTTYVLLILPPRRGAGAWLMADPRAQRTLAGHWYAFVSLPFLQFVWLRWFYRIGVWAWLLRRVSRLDLRLNPAHPDGAGGLGFLGECSVPFGLLLFAAGSVLASEGLRRALSAGEVQDIVWLSYLVLVVLSLAVFVGPLLVFWPALRKLKRRGTLEYGALASRYTELFARRWVERADADGDLLGSPDLQSLADLAGTYERIQRNRGLPLDRRDIVAMVLPGSIPLVLLVMASMPLREMVATLLRLLV